MLGQELLNGAMDFQSTNVSSDGQNHSLLHQHHSQFAAFIHQQQSSPQPTHDPSHSQAEHPSSAQLFRADSHQSQHHHQQQYQQDSQPHTSSQYQSSSDPQLSGDSYHVQPPFTSDISSQQQQQAQQSQASSAEYQYSAQAPQDIFNGMANSQPPLRSSASPPQAPPTQQPEPNAEPSLDPQFDIFEWYPKYQSCQRYFIDHAQQSAHVQAVAAFINVALPLQRASNPIPPTPSRQSPPSLTGPPQRLPHQLPTSVSLIPYLRRLVVTGLDFPGVLHGFFGDDWVSGVGPLHEQERRNYLFAAKSGGWASVKKDYDMSPLETVPFMRPLQGPVIVEIEAAEKSWSEWLAMEDWMVGPRAPDAHRQGTAANTHQREGGRR